MSNRLIISLLAFLSYVCLANAQESPFVGFSMDRHMGPVISKDVSKSGNIVATVAKDYTLMIWDYPSYSFKKKINLPGDNISPVSYGKCIILPTNPNIVLIADNTGDIYEGDIYKSRLHRYLRKGKKKDALVLFPDDEREGFFYNNAVKSIKAKYSFIAVDVEQGKVIDRVGALSSHVANFVFSPDQTYLLAVSEGEEAILYDAWGLRQVSQFVLEDEKILDGCFLNNDELVIITDINYYKFRIYTNEVNSVVEKELLIKQRIKRRNEFTSIRIDKEDGVAYLFYWTWSMRNRFFGGSKVLTINLFDGKKVNKSIESFFAPSAADYKQKEGVKIEVRHGISNGDGTLIHDKVVDISESQRTGIIREMIRDEKIKSFLKTTNDSIDNYNFEYRFNNHADIKIKSDGICFSYPEFFGKLDKNGVHIIDNDTERYDFENRNKWIDIKEASFFINPYSRVPQIYKTGDNSFSINLPIDAYAICPWLNEHHFVVSLMDGSIRWYNTHDGKEELALFVSKDKHYIVWTPNGRYMSDSDVLSEAIEWRYRRYSNVVTTRPVEERWKYYRPTYINQQIEQLFDTEVEYLNSRYIGPNESNLTIESVIVDSTHYWLSYSVSNYNPVKYGPYELEILIDDTYQIEDFEHLYKPNGGIVSFTAPEELRIIELGLLVDNKGQQKVLTYDTKPIGEDLTPQEIYLTCVGINDYDNYLEYSDLVAPIHDAYAIKSVFERFSSRTTKVQNIAVYHNDVTKERLKERLDNIGAKSTSNTMSVFYFSGHGDTKDGHYVFVADKEIIDIPWLITQASTIPGYKLFILDACYSGASFESDYENMAILASSDAKTPSEDGTVLTESPFTKALVDILMRNVKDGNKLNLNELYQLLVSELGEDSNRIPQMYNTIGEINILRP